MTRLLRWHHGAATHIRMGRTNDGPVIRHTSQEVWGAPPSEPADIRVTLHTTEREVVDADDMSGGLSLAGIPEIAGESPTECFDRLWAATPDGCAWGQIVTRETT